MQINNLEETHNYWRFFCNYQSTNVPKDYLHLKERSIFLCDLIKRLFDTNIKILEIGCNVGRNLEYLRQYGYTNLSGIEINPQAVIDMEEYYPELYKNITLYEMPVESVIKSFPDDKFDLVFTMAVFEHIHPDSNWVFPEVKRITKNLITIEDEDHLWTRVFPRNYNRIFTELGMTQAEEVNLEKCNDEDLKKLKCRVFKK